MVGYRSLVAVAFLCVGWVVISTVQAHADVRFWTPDSQSSTSSSSVQIINAPRYPGGNLPNHVDEPEPEEILVSPVQIIVAPRRGRPISLPIHR